LAAALRLDEDADERELVPDDFALDPERELDVERPRELEDARLRLDADRPLEERLLEERPLEDRLLPDRLELLDFFLPPELPLLRPSAICSPS